MGRKNVPGSEGTACAKEQHARRAAELSDYVCFLELCETKALCQVRQQCGWSARRLGQGWEMSVEG